ncbi:MULTISPECIES: hypothetical protein [Flavobacteriaceae]|uniref:hypothetical protein n=1 Tax=Flavobacteriaceae TaxID=49546 RepID=UPI0014912FFE|nr:MULTISPECIES: hypothetical protein [Allomuricauda]MDC6367590.1 hypothetical protein [Muricauda sp. AC10]
MLRKLILIVVLMLWGCHNAPINEADLSYLNGYWEISEVEFPDGTKKAYGMNQNIDFIQLKDGKGFRKKLQPKFNGTYSTSKDQELLTIGQTNDRFILHYSNEFNEWEEELVQLDSISFSVRNEEGIQYTYTRFQPISIPK